MNAINSKMLPMLLVGGIVIGFYLYGKSQYYANESAFRSLPQVHYVDSTYHARIDSMNKAHDAQIDSLRIKYHKRLENIMGE